MGSIYSMSVTCCVCISTELSTTIPGSLSWTVATRLNFIRKVNRDMVFPLPAPWHGSKISCPSFQSHGSEPLEAATLLCVATDFEWAVMMHLSREDYSSLLSWNPHFCHYFQRQATRYPLGACKWGIKLVKQACLWKATDHGSLSYPFTMQCYICLPKEFSSRLRKKLSLRLQAYSCIVSLKSVTAP